MTLAMSATRPRPKLNLRAASAALALLLGWLSAPIALASFTPDVCSMSCCVAAGHCCCTPRHALVEGQIPDGEPQIDQAEASTNCPKGCAAQPSLSQTRDAERAANHELDCSSSSFSPAPLIFVPGDQMGLDNSSPRAPPIRSLNLPA